MNEKSYNRCVQVYADRLLRFIVKNIQNVESSKDIVQNCFEALWKNKEKVSEEKVKSYLFQVAHNQIVDVYRKGGRMLYVENYHENSLATSEESFDEKHLLNLAFNKLPTNQKNMILLKDYEGYSYAEIGEIMNLNQGQVKINLFRARKKLKKIVEQSLKIQAS